MSFSSVVQAATAAAALIGAVGTFVNRAGIKVVHKAVNSTAQKQNRRTDQLTAALTAANIPVPAREEPTGDEVHVKPDPPDDPDAGI